MSLLKHPALRRALDRPLLFNAVRGLIAGDQSITRRLVGEELDLSGQERVLDVCCGTGDFAAVVPGAYVGVDLNRAFIDYARRRHRGDPRKQFLVADALHTGLPDRYFDKAMFISGLHHFSDAVATAILSEVARLTRERVVVVDLVPEVGSPLSRLLARLDRGDYVRPVAEKTALVERVLAIERHRLFHSRLAVQVIYRCAVR